MSAITAEDDCIRICGVRFEDGFPIVRDQDWAAPAMSEIHISQNWMQGTNSMLEAQNEFSRLSRIDSYVVQFSPMFRVNESASKNHPICRQEAAP